MVVDWALYEKLLRSGADACATEKDIAARDAVNNFADGILSDPAYQPRATVNGVITPIVAARSSAIKCAIKAMPGSRMHIGDMVSCLNEDWIIAELYEDKVGIMNGEMWLCNMSMRFQNGSAEIHTRKCVVDNGTYSKRSSDPDAFVPTNTYRVYMSIDDATQMLCIDKRIGFGEIYSQDGTKVLEVYKIVGVDTKSENHGDGSHMMMLTMQRDVYNAESDSIKENVCDIITETGHVAAPTSLGRCTITGRDSIRIGTTRKYSVSYVDASGSDIDGVESVWFVDAPDGVKYEASSQSCSISIPLDGGLVGETIRISVSDKDNMYGMFEKKVQVITVG